MQHQHPHSLAHAHQHQQTLIINSNKIGTNLKNNKNNNNNNNNFINTHNSLDALPKQFVASMKTLFDILDDQQTGLVKFSDIEKGWQDDGCKGLPYGVIDSLRKVTPASGLLSFERFCAGLKLCLLRNQTELSIQRTTSASAAAAIAAATTVNATTTTTTAADMGATNYLSTKTQTSPIKTTRPPSTPALEIENPLPKAPFNTWNCVNSNTATVRPHNIITQRALSLPQLSPDSELDTDLETSTAAINGYNTLTTASVVGTANAPPPKPPRASAVNNNSALYHTQTVKSSLGATQMKKAEIRNALQNWQMGILLNEMEIKDKRKTNFIQHNNSIPQYNYRSSGDVSGKHLSTSMCQNENINATLVKKSNSKRKEPRRHTLQNGIDYNMLKRLKQLEEEREVLLLGLEAVEKARDWYLQQMANVQEKIMNGAYMEQCSDLQQERVSFQRARVLEVNRNLSMLSDTWERGSFPLYFNLAIGAPKKPHGSTSTGAGINVNSLQPPLDRLRQQNRHLTNEINLKSDRITLLEREKQVVMRELFELRQRLGLTVHGSGFISVQSSPVCSSSSGGLGDADVVY